MTERQIHNQDETKQIFLKHLEYLFALNQEVRSDREDYQSMVRILKREDHWKGKSRGTHKKKKHRVYLG